MRKERHRWEHEIGPAAGRYRFSSQGAGGENDANATLSKRQQHWRTRSRRDTIAETHREGEPETSNNNNDDNNDDDSNNNNNNDNSNNNNSNESLSHFAAGYAMPLAGVADSNHSNGLTYCSHLSSGLVQRTTHAGSNNREAAVRCEGAVLYPPTRKKKPT